MGEPTVVDDVDLVYTSPIDGKTEVHAYFQPHNGEVKVHIRLVGIRKDGTVVYTPRGIALSPESVSDLLIAVALLAAKARTAPRGSTDDLEPVEVLDLEPGDE
jgi:hypothetical protein